MISDELKINKFKELRKIQLLVGDMNAGIIQTNCTDAILRRLIADGLTKGEIVAKIKLMGYICHEE